MDMTPRTNFMTAGITSPPAEHTVGAGLLRGMMEFVVARGANRKVPTERCGIDLNALLDQERRIPFSSYVKVMKAGQEMLADPARALQYGEVTVSPVSPVRRSTEDPPSRRRENRVERMRFAYGPSCGCHKIGAKCRRVQHRIPSGLTLQLFQRLWPVLFEQT